MSIQIEQGEQFQSREALEEENRSLREMAFGQTRIISGLRRQVIELQAEKEQMVLARAGKS